MTRIAVLGSINMDLVAVTGRRPLPGETVAGEQFFMVPGGKGLNQAVAAAKAGADVSLLGCVGTDPFASTILSALDELGLPSDGIHQASGATGVAHIVVDGDARNSIIVVPGANATLTALTDTHRRTILSADVLLLQQELPLSVVEEAAQYASAHGVAVVLTPAPVQTPSTALLSYVDVLVPNEHEAIELCGRLGHDVETATAAGAILARYCRSVVVTLGAEGAVWFSGDQSHRVSAFPVEAVDTTAAGDTFVGALAAVGIPDRKPTAPGLRFASAAAALACLRSGATSSMPSATEVNDFLGVAA